MNEVIISSLKAEMEQKHYPRDPQRDQIHTGRVRVQLINEEGEFCNDLHVAQNSCLHTLCGESCNHGRRFSLYVGVPNLVEPCLLVIK